MEFIDYIIKNRLILIPVLFIIGSFIKSTEFINNKWIPLILMFCGIILSIFMGGKIIDNIIQGILVSGASVLPNKIKSGDLNE